METTFSVEEFNTSGWQDIVIDVQKNRQFKSAFSNAARHAEEQGENWKVKYFELLASCCSMMLSPEVFNEPFKPEIVWEGQRTLIASDLNPESVQFLSQIVQFVSNPWLKARLADISWLMLKPRNPAFALEAIDNYTKVLLNEDLRKDGGLEQWKRAIFLCTRLGKVTNNRLELINQTLFSAIIQVPDSKSYLVIWLADLLGLAKSNQLFKIARRLDLAAQYLRSSNEFERAKEHFGKAAQFYERAKHNGFAVQAAISGRNGD